MRHDVAANGLERVLGKHARVRICSHLQRTSTAVSPIAVRGNAGDIVSV